MLVLEETTRAKRADTPHEQTAFFVSSFDESGEITTNNSIHHGPRNSGQSGGSFGGRGGNNGGCNGKGKMQKWLKSRTTISSN